MGILEDRRGVVEDKMNITIIGGGHIGVACALGLRDVASIKVTVRSAESLARYNYAGISASRNNKEAVIDADIVMFCVRTPQLQEAVDSVKDLLGGKLVVSMAAQMPPKQMKEMVGEGIELAYVIPNVAIAHKESMTFISSVSASEASVKLLEELFSTAGKVLVVPMEMLKAGISLASCGIGYALNYIAAASRGGEKLGFSRGQAVEIVTQTVLGAALVQDASNDSPGDEVRKVATPGGLTERGVNAMENAGFSASVIASLFPDD